MSRTVFALFFLSCTPVMGCLPGGGVDWPQVKNALDAVPSICYRDGEKEVCISKHDGPPADVVMGGPEGKCEP